MMASVSISKVTKLTIKSYKKPPDPKAKKTENGVTFEVMFNPETVKQRYSLSYEKDRGGGKKQAKPRFVRRATEIVDLELVFDGTITTDLIGLPPGPAKKSVRDRVDEFLKATYYFEKSHEPPFLVLSWGGLWKKGFKCRMTSVSVTYNRFGRDGAPLRATLAVSFQADERLTRPDSNSPDLTDRHQVRAGDSLPALAARFYGSAEHVLFAARENQLDDLRFLSPGTELRFPPLPGYGKRGTERR